MDILATLFPPPSRAGALPFCRPAEPGPDFFLLVGYAIAIAARQRRPVYRHCRRKRSVYSSGHYRLGILRQAPLLFTVIELLGAAYLLWIGSLLLRSRPTTLALHGASASRPPLVKQLFSRAGFFAAQSENALFYLALMTSCWARTSRWCSRPSAEPG